MTAGQRQDRAFVAALALCLVVLIGIGKATAQWPGVPSGGGAPIAPGTYVELDPAAGGQTITQPVSGNTAALIVDDDNGSERINIGANNQIRTAWSINPYSDGASNGLGSWDRRFGFIGVEHVRYGPAEEFTLSAASPDYTTAPEQRDTRVECTSGTTCGWDLPGWGTGHVVSITVDSGSDDVILKGSRSYFSGGATLTLSACDSVMVKNSAGTWIQIAPVVSLNTCPDEI